MDFKGKKIAILGFGVEGKDALNFLRRTGASVSVYDKKAERELDLKGIDVAGFNFTCGEDYLSSGLENFDVVIRSPGVYRYLPEITSAEKKGVLIISTIKIFFDLCPAKIIGVTGTKGKGTTSTLIYRILKKSGLDVYLAGNIGTPVLDLLSKLKKKSWVVLELSSFQLIDLHKSPHIAVVLNITTDHLDWHKDRSEYVESKLQIVKFQKRNDYVVINFDYKTSKDFAKYTKANIRYFSANEKVQGSYVNNGKIILELEEGGWVIGEVGQLKLRGRHNWENVCASVCASALAGADIDSIKKAVFSFKGLAHRLEFVGEIDGISFYNDSISTNPQTTIAAVRSFFEPKTLILGGSDKGLNYDEMASLISNDKSVKTIALIGQIAPIIKNSFENANFKGKVLNMGSSSMDTVVKKAYNSTSRGGVVLLSPSTASFDMFKDYKDRGEKFKKSVRKLKTQYISEK